MTDPRISFVVGPGGWAVVGWDEHTAYVRFALNDDQTTWRIAEVRVVDPTRDVLRRFPFRRVENAANAHSSVVLGLAIGHTQEVTDVPAVFEGHEPVTLSRIKLRRPKGKQLDLNFYKAVAIAYKGALAEGLDPRQTLARDSGSAADTVARWVREARRLELLPPTTPGKVS